MTLLHLKVVPISDVSCFICYVVPGIDFGSPTCTDFVRGGIDQIVVSYANARTLLYDSETGETVLSLDSAVTYGTLCLSLYVLF